MLQTILLSYAAPVIIWNIVWIIEGLDNFKEMYNGTLDKTFSLVVWTYTLSGIIALIIALNL